MNEPIGALAHLGLGRSYVLSHDSPKAKTQYQSFLSLWKDADPDISILKQAKAELREGAIVGRDGEGFVIGHRRFEVRQSLATISIFEIPHLSLTCLFPRPKICSSDRQNDFALPHRRTTRRRRDGCCLQS